MLKSYFKTAIRFLWRHKAYSFLNVLGLTVGLACSFFILLWVQDELRYDRFHEEGDQLYRVMRNAHFSDGQIYTWSAIPKPLAATLEEDYPEVTHAVLMTWGGKLLFSRGDQTFREQGYHAGPAFFEIFSFPFLLGDPGTAMNDPYAVVISESLARKYFGPDWQTSGRVLGQTIRIENRDDFTITGVFADVPEHSTLQFDFVIPAEEFFRRNEWVEHWGNSGMQLFVRLREDADPAAVNAKIKDVIREHQEGAAADIFLQPYTDIHLYSDYRDGVLVGGRIDYVRMFVIVAIFILLIAGINFMNLATARSGMRAREIGVRKAVGATQRALIGQFTGESVLMALLAFVLAMLLVAFGLSFFNGLTGKAFTLGSLDPQTLLLFFGLAVLTGMLAGSYPALYLASFNVVGVLRGGFKQRPGGAGLRKGLVVFQFAMSILLIIGTMTIHRQVGYIVDKNLGLDRENVLFLRLEGGVRDQYDTFKQELLQRPGIAGVTTSSQNPLSVGSSTTDPTWPGKDPESEMLFHIINANYDFVETMKMELAAGRAFSKDFARDSVNYLINEQAARAMGVEDPVGTRLTFWEREGEVIGVVRDFHMASLYAPIEPTIIRFDPDETGMLFVRTEPGRTAEAIESLRGVYGAFNPDYPFEYQFMDENYEEMYRSEQMVGALSGSFAGLAILIACLGLFGLASFTAEQRTKEIGIRKVLGATVSNIVVLLSRDFIVLVLLAFFLTVPVAYFVTKGWLDNFAYHIDPGIGIFVLAGLAAMAIALLTVGYQAIRAAVVNPVESLRTE